MSKWLRRLRLELKVLVDEGVSSILSRPDFFPYFTINLITESVHLLTNNY